MSSLAATQADGFYFPPEWTPAMGGLSKYQGSKGANQYQISGVIRFEIPFDGWCVGCERHIGKGTRFNAKKEKAGKYLSTQLWSFQMKCPSCDTQILIKTDPEHRTYDFAEGIRKMEQEYETDAITDNVEQVLSDESKLLLKTDPMFKLQHENEDKRRAQSVHDRLESLLDLQHATTKHDGDSNKRLRQNHRERKHHSADLLAEGQARGLAIPLVDRNDASLQQGEELSFSTLYNQSQQRRKSKEREKVTAVLSECIFSPHALVSKPKKKQGDKALKSSRSSSGKQNAPPLHAATDCSKVSRKKGVAGVSNSSSRSIKAGLTYQQSIAKKFASQNINVSKMKIAR